MHGAEIISKFHAVLPEVRKWIEGLLEKHATNSVPVNSLDFRRLPQHFHDDILEKAKVVIVPEVPFPPLGRLGLPELSFMEQMPLSGITYVDTFFIQHPHRTEESLHFHELVHVIQWNRLGVVNFLLAYGVGIVQSGYEQSPLEQMAYNLQRAFDRDSLPDNLIQFIQKETDTIWQGVAPLVGQ
jgi:hypothetical protein